MTRSLLRRQLWLSAVAFLALACSGSGGAPKVPLADKVTTDSIARATAEAHALIGPEAKAALDSGNALFRRKDYVRALAEYRHASELAPQHSAPLFGIYMVAGATNNKPLADSALAGIRVRNGPLPPGEAGAPHSMSDSSLKVLRAQMKKGAKPV